MLSRGSFWTSVSLFSEVVIIDVGWQIAYLKFTQQAERKPAWEEETSSFNISTTDE